MRLAARLSALRRPALWLFRGVLLVAVSAFSVAAARLVEQHIRTSEAFAIGEILIEGQERLQREEILEASGLALGSNIFDSSPEEVEQSLRSHPWVASATVHRRLPRSYRIELREHDPAALLAMERLYLVADDGTVFKPLEPGDPDALPVITGIDREQFTSDRVLRTSLLVSAVALLHDYRDVGLWRREPISEIHASEDGSFALYVGDDATQVRLGARPFREKLRRLRKVFDRLRKREARAHYVYLDNVRRPDRVTVRLR